MSTPMMTPLNINCKKCGRSFDRGEQMSLYNNNYYHNTCFVCNFCEQSLAGQGFFTKPDGSFQCKRCHEYHTPKCFICNNSIADGVKVNVFSLTKIEQFYNSISSKTKAVNSCCEMRCEMKFKILSSLLLTTAFFLKILNHNHSAGYTYMLILKDFEILVSSYLLISFFFIVDILIQKSIYNKKKNNDNFNSMNVNLKQIKLIKASLK